MTASVNHRIAGAFQEGKDPQQDAIIHWMEGLPKDSRGGVKRSVLKYHLTRALLLYIQSGLDTTATLLSAPAGVQATQAPVPLTAPKKVGSSVVSEVEKYSDSSNSVERSQVPVINTQVPVLNDPVRKPADIRASLRSKIARSMAAS